MGINTRSQESTDTDTLPVVGEEYAQKSKGRIGESVGRATSRSEIEGGATRNASFFSLPIQTTIWRRGEMHDDVLHPRTLPHPLERQLVALEIAHRRVPLCGAEKGQPREGVSISSLEKHRKKGREEGKREEK